MHTNLDVSIKTNKMFWETIKSFLSDKWTNLSKILNVSYKEVISDDQQLCKTFFNFFQDAGKTLGMKGDVQKSNCLEYNDPVENVIRKYNRHSRIRKTKKIINISLSTAELAEPAGVEKKIKSLNILKV